MADLISTPGGQIHKRNQKYVDDGDGSHSEVRSVNLYVWDTGLLAWRKLVPSDFANAGGPVTIADGADVAEGAVGAAAWSGSGNGTVVSILKAIWTRLRGGQTTMALSLPVALASDQSSIPVAATLGTETTKVIGTVNQGTSPWVTSATIAAPTAVVNGGKNIAVTGTAVNLPSGACIGVVITANSTNAASIFVGTSAVTKDYGATTSGAELQAGQSVGLAIDNINRVYVNGTSGDGVNWLAS